MRVAKSVKKHMAFGNFVTIFIVGGFIGWASFTSISGAVVATGSLVVETDIKKIQHQTGGIVGEVRVKDGDKVKEGDILVVLDDTLTRTNLNIHKSQIDAKMREKEFTLKELGSVKDLFQRKLATIMRLNQLEKDAARIDGELGTLLASYAQDQDQVKRITLRSPQTGVIHESAIHAIGEVVQPGQVIMLIVPEQDRLLVEVKVLPQDRDQIYQGQHTEVKFTSFNQKTTPELVGMIERIAPDIITDPRTGVNSYVVRIAVSADEIGKLGNIKLFPGMPAEVFIHTEERKVINYLVKPIADQIARAFRER